MSGWDVRLGGRHPSCQRRSQRRDAGDMAMDVRLKVVRADNESALLTAVGFRWAKLHQAEGRDTPSRRTAYELGHHALGRNPTQCECIAIQRAARAANSGRHREPEMVPSKPAA